MAQYLLSILCLMASMNLFAHTITHPSKLQTGADFSHLSCAIFSEDSVDDDETLDRFNIALKEFGNGAFNEGSINLHYGKNHKCEALIKFKMEPNTRTAKVISTSASRNVACREGALAINELFSNGFIFRQSLRNHARFSLELIGMSSSLCDNGPIYLEFLRTR